MRSSLLLGPFLMVFSRLWAFFFLSFFLNSCSYVTPEAENELRGFEKAHQTHIVRDGILSVKKSIFGYRMIQEENRVDDTQNREMLWLCGWAPISQSGKWKGIGGLTATPYQTQHCNMQFRISKDGFNLEARTVDLNYPNDYESWPLLFTIPILSHYFYERDVDNRGRELNRFRKVTDRKNWQLAPSMDLDLKSIRWWDRERRSGDWFWGGALTDVYDIEISTEQGQQFLGFSGTHVHGLWGSNVQHTYRFNFLEIKKNPGFKKTYYHRNNSRYLNVVHLLGYQPDGSSLNEVQYAAHWDLSEPVEFCLNGFPEDGRNYKQIALDVIQEMNETMKKIGAVPEGQQAFKASDRQMKYDFDLRCPSITWVDDPILSFKAPLGIGLANTDIRTGEILWGGAVIWGGLMDYIVNRESESVADALARNTFERIEKRNSIKGNPYFQDINQHLSLRGGGSLQSMETLIHNKMNFPRDGESLRSRLEEVFADLQREPTEESRKERLKRDLEAYVLEEIQQNLSVGAWSTKGSRYKGLDFEKEYQFEPIDLANDSDLLWDLQDSHRDKEQLSQEVSRLTGMVQTPHYDEQELEKKHMVEDSGLTMDKLIQLISHSQESHGAFLDMDHTVDRIYDSVTRALGSINGGLEREAAAKRVIKNITLHEFGHVVGLGHQFAANQRPERGTIPPSLYASLIEAQVPQGHYYSSIMDYMSGRLEVSLPYEKVKLQIQDELVLSYLYKQEYSTYAPGEDEFKMIPLEANNGIIPSTTFWEGKTRSTRYMPQCSDLDAWLGTNPYCRRWDEGHDAPSMVEANQRDYTDNLVSRLNSFTDATGGFPWWRQYHLWASTYRLVNHNRTFYDKLRYQLLVDDHYRSIFDQIKGDEEALYSFSQACVDPSKAPENRSLTFTKLTLQPTPGASGFLRVSDRQNRMTDGDYARLYRGYEAVLGSRNTEEMTDDEFEALEKELYGRGIAYSELQKLCRATSKSLDTMKFLLSLKGPDHVVIKNDSEVVPTSVIGAQATKDYSRIFGTYSQLGILPIKLAALDVLTSPSSTMSYAWWEVPKPKYSNPNDGKYGYYPLYPFEFTGIIETAVRNNMRFGGTAIQDSASMSIANLYMNHFLFRTFSWSNDTQERGFHSNYIEDLKAQTRFEVDLVPVLLETIERKPSPRRFGFRPKLFNQAKRRLVDLDRAYALPDREVIISGNDAEILMPITKMRYLGQDSFYVWALYLTYDKTSYDDPLIAYSIKTAINELTIQELDKCIGGNRGLSSFFDSEEFKGFDIRPDIAKDQTSQARFENSLKEAFHLYQNREGFEPFQRGCEQSKNGIGLITATALSLNGYFSLGVFDFVKK